MGGGSGSVAVGFVLLALAAIPVVAGRLSRRRRALAAIAGVDVRETPTDPQHATHPSRPRTFELRLGSVDATTSWRPRGVAWLLGRNGLIVALDLAILAVLAGAAVAADRPPAGWLAILAVVALLPLASAALALRAGSDRPAGAAHGPSRADVAAAWVGWITIAGAAIVLWVAVALLGLGLVLGAGS